MEAVGLIRKILYALFYKNKFFIPMVGCICLAIAFLMFSLFSKIEAKNRAKSNEITPASMMFNVPVEAMEHVLDVVTENGENSASELTFVNLLSLLAAKYDGDWSEFDKADLKVLVSEFKSGATEKQLSQPFGKTYSAFKSFYESIFKETVGPFKISKKNNAQGQPIFENKFGLKAYFPIAYNFETTFLNDYEKENKHLSSTHHLGVDLNSKLKTPVVAVESGIVKECGKTHDFGWQVVIQSFDGLRTYYYSNCYKNKPFATGIKPKVAVKAGQVVAYVGATSCCSKKVVRAQHWPHLHFGMSLKLKNQPNQPEVHLNPYRILQFLQHHKSVVEKSKEDFGFVNKYKFKDPSYEAYVNKHKDALGIE